MITHFLGAEEVRAFARDLAQRLKKLESRPQTWFALGRSGQILANILADYIDQTYRDSIKFVRVNVNRNTGETTFLDEIEGTIGTALILDSAVHSGKSMLAAAHTISAKGFEDIITYSLVLKRGAALIPNYFGVLIDETDRCLFELDEIPNNRLIEKAPFGLLRKIAESDTQLSFFELGGDPEERDAVGSSFGSLFYERERGSHVYVYEHLGKIVGVLSFTEQNRSIFIDLVANSQEYRGKGVGASLMRWAETWARSRRFEVVDLWAIKSRVDFYEKRDFFLQGREINLGKVTFCLMRRKLLYNISFVDQIATL